MCGSRCVGRLCNGLRGFILVFGRLTLLFATEGEWRTALLASAHQEHHQRRVQFSKPSCIQCGPRWCLARVASQNTHGADAKSRSPTAATRRARQLVRRIVDYWTRRSQFTLLPRLPPGRNGFQRLYIQCHCLLLRHVPFSQNHENKKSKETTARPPQGSNAPSFFHASYLALATNLNAEGAGSRLGPTVACLNAAYMASCCASLSLVFGPCVTYANACLNSASDIYTLLLQWNPTCSLSSRNEAPRRKKISRVRQLRSMSGVFWSKGWKCRKRT